MKLAELAPMKLPGALKAFTTEMRSRYASGACLDVADTTVVVLFDEVVGPFLRLSFSMKDGTTFDIDTLEVSNLLRRFTAHPLSGTVH